MRSFLTLAILSLPSFTSGDVVVGDSLFTDDGLNLLQLSSRSVVTGTEKDLSDDDDLEEESLLSGEDDWGAVVDDDAQSQPAIYREARVTQASVKVRPPSSREGTIVSMCNRDRRCKGVIQIRNKWMQIYPGSATLVRGGKAAEQPYWAIQSVKMKLTAAPKPPPPPPPPRPPPAQRPTYREGTIDQASVKTKPPSSRVDQAMFFATGTPSARVSSKSETNGCRYILVQPL